jgi:hypothetical protein
MVQELWNVVLKLTGSILDIFRVSVGFVDEEKRLRFGKLRNKVLVFLLLCQCFVDSFQCFITKAQFVVLIKALVEDGEDIDDIVFFVEIVTDLYGVA